MTPERATVVEFSFPYQDSPVVSFVSHEPGKLPKAMGLIWPFTVNVWISLGVGTIIVALSIYLVSKDLTVRTEKELLKQFVATMGLIMWSLVLVSKLVPTI
jgi:hypothetical protein